jgi:hypothetical protein
MCFFKEMFGGLSSMTSSICSIFVKQAEVDGKKVELEITQISEKMKTVLLNDEFKENMTDLKVLLQEHYNGLFESSEKTTALIERVSHSLSSLEAKNDTFIKDNQQFQKVMTHFACAASVATVLIGGIIVYKIVTTDNKVIIVLPDDFETKQKVLAQMKVSRQAYTECTNNELLPNGSANNCNALFEEYLKTDKLFRETFSEKKE